MDKDDIPASNREKDNTAYNNTSITDEKKEINLESIGMPALDKEKIIGTATSEMEYRVELFNRLTYTCFSKCVDKRYKDNELNIGESSCIDRCVSKYTQVNNIIGNVLAYGRRDV